MSETALSNYQEFIRKYAKEHRIAEEEAKGHALCKEVKAYYEEIGERTQPKSEAAYETGRIGCDR